MANEHTLESAIPFATEWVLVEDNTECEYRINIAFSPAALDKVPKRRMVRSKTYEASFVDQETDPRIVPQYINDILSGDVYNGNTKIANYPNPESLSPTGVDKNKWHIDSKEYTKELSTPMTRRIRVTWVMQGDWETYTE